MCLNSRKYYIPGETSENTKMRQKAIQSGILIISTFTYLNSNNDRLKQYFYNELIDRLDEEDYQLHFEFQDSSFRQFRQIISDQKQVKELPLVDNAPILFIPKSKIQTVNSDGEGSNLLSLQNNQITSPIISNRNFDSLQLDGKKSTNNFDNDCLLSAKDDEPFKSSYLAGILGSMQ